MSDRGFRYSWWWKTIGMVLAIANIIAGYYNAKNGLAWPALGEGLLGGWIVGTVGALSQAREKR